MKMGLAPYQKQAVDLSLKSFADGLHKISISMTASAGKTTTALSIAEEFINHHKNSKVLYLCRFRAHVEQIKHRLIEQNPKLSIATSMKTYNTEKFLITTYQNLLDTYQKDLLLNFTLVVCDDADTMKSPLYNDIFSTQKSFFVGLVSNTNIERTCWFFDSKTIFEYVYTDYVNKFYNENIAINDFIIPLLTKCHFKNINTSNFPQYKVKPDVIVEKRGEQVVFEVKTYRGIKNESQVIYSAVQHVKEIRRGLEPDTTTKTKFGIIMFCDVNEKLKQELIKQNSIFIWDIKNLMYICNGDEELLGRLAKLVPYPINDINPVVPIDDLNAIISNQSNQLELSHILSEGETLVERLNNCKYGKKDNSAVLYEEVCNDVIKFLFSNEFSQFSTQHKTKDKMFRMDLLCSLKGTTEFWKFIIQFYNTKFVVFEYKNYSKKIEQNLIYITEKYLFSAALRNIAFIISRKGFDKNSHDAALGVLKETGKFIVDITDKDLIEMIKMKEKGEEPSDFLMNKVENLLMSVSK